MIPITSLNNQKHLSFGTIRVTTKKECRDPIHHLEESKKLFNNPGIKEKFIITDIKLNKKRNIRYNSFYYDYTYSDEVNGQILSKDSLKYYDKEELKESILAQIITKDSCLKVEPAQEEKSYIKSIIGELNDESKEKAKAEIVNAIQESNMEQAA